MASEIDLPPFLPLRKSRSFNSLSLPSSSSTLLVEGLEIETDQTLPLSFSLPPTDPVIGTNTTSLLEPVFPLSEPVAPLSPLTSEAVTVPVCDSPSKYLASVNIDNAGDDSSSKLAPPVTFGSHCHVNSLMNSLAKNSVAPSVLDVLPQSASMQKPSSLGVKNLSLPVPGSIQLQETSMPENPTASPNFIPTLPTLVDSQSTPTTTFIMESSPSTVINTEVSETLVVGPLAQHTHPLHLRVLLSSKGQEMWDWMKMGPSHLARSA
ncbi:unnamed protein product [Brassica napus]|uniref:(rape) hypothetical protein n=1 Tax=Brassica napus TaxID=3708 RepID=A0A816YWD6_BRANA|nr:unnamed protein product [Brassica napus]